MLLIYTVVTKIDLMSITNELLAIKRQNELLVTKRQNIVSDNLDYCYLRNVDSATSFIIWKTK